MPKVSIISPMYNTAPYVRSTIESIKAQTMTDYEVIIVDDHSTDNSVDIAREAIAGDQRFKMLQTPRNSGPGLARNIGLENAEGEYITFIDSDDTYHPDFLRLLCDAVADGKDLAYCQLKFTGGKKRGKIHRNPIVEGGEFSVQKKKRFLSGFVTFSPCFIYKRQFLEDHGLSFPDFRNSEDTIFLTKCLLLANTIDCVDEPLYSYNIHENSLTTCRNPLRYKERLNAINSLMDDFKQLKQRPEYETLQLSSYDNVMRLIWLKKGLAQCIIEITKHIFRI